MLTFNSFFVNPKLIIHLFFSYQTTQQAFDQMQGAGEKSFEESPRKKLVGKCHSLP
jgi:hypothetical protein